MLKGGPAERGSLSLEPSPAGHVRCHPGRVRTIIEALDRAVRRFPDVAALETAEGDVTDAEFAELVEEGSSGCDRGRDHPREFVQLIDQRRITSLMVVPSVWPLLLHDVRVVNDGRTCPTASPASCSSAAPVGGHLCHSGRRSHGRPRHRPELGGRHMADFALPRHIRAVDVISRNRTGKIDELALRETMEKELQSAATRVNAR